MPLGRFANIQVGPGDLLELQTHLQNTGINSTGENDSFGEWAICNYIPADVPLLPKFQLALLNLQKLPNLELATLLTGYC